MRLQYSITRADLFRAGIRAMLHQRAMWIVLIPLLGFSWWSSFNWPEARNESLLVRMLTATFTSALCAGIGAIGGCAVVALQSFFRRDKGVLGTHTLEITEEGLIESTEVNRALANWKTSFRIRETGRYAYIYVSESTAHIVPKLRIAEGSVAEFLLELRARIQSESARPKDNPPMQSQNADSPARPRQ
jgi:hypothetical protein